MYWFTRKYHQIERVISYLPIIWRGYDFDYSTTIEVFQHQLKRTADFLDSSSASTLDAKQRARRIRTAIELMQKVYNDEYANEYMDYIDKQYGESYFDFVPIEGSDHFEVILKNKNATNEEHQKAINKIDDTMRKMCYERQERAHRLLWKFIEHNIRSWWD
jgi:hypothetical protein